VLAERWPAVPNLGDVNDVTEWDIQALGHIDVVIFGSPCQDLSIAGKQKGLTGERSGLFHVGLSIARWARPRWILWENVFGAFSSCAGRDFATVVGAMAGCDVTVPPKGWGNEGAVVGQEAMVEWSTLDAQWFGVAQRRRRVFALADFGDWRSRRPVLLEPESLRGDSAPSRSAGQGATGSPAAGAGVDGVLPPVAMCLNAGGVNRLDAESQTLIAFHHNAQVDQMNFDPHTAACCEVVKQAAVCLTGQVTHALNTCNNGKGSSEDGTGRGTPIVAVDFYNGDIAAEAATLRVHCEYSCGQGVIVGPSVRRLTEIECERLQGFPDGHTDVGLSSGARYKALGNSMAVPVIRWIGRQIEAAS